MKTWLIILIVGMFISCSESANKNRELEKYEKSKKSIAEQEKENPLDFLQVSGSDKKNLIGQTVVRGLIQNKASVASYKKVRLKLLYYTNGVLVANHEEVMDEVIKPNNNLDFKVKYFTPKGTDSVAVSIMSAKAAD